MFERVKNGILAFVAARKILRTLRKNLEDARENPAKAIDYAYVLPEVRKVFVRALYEVVGTDEKEFNNILYTIGQYRYEEETRLKKIQQQEILDVNNLIREICPRDYEEE